MNKGVKNMNKVMNSEGTNNKAMNKGVKNMNEVMNSEVANNEVMNKGVKNMNEVMNSEVANNEAILNFINPAYEFDYRLPYCQWDLRDVSMVKTNSPRIDLRYKATIEQLKRYAQAKGKESFGFGMLVTKEQAEMCNFKLGQSWSEGYVVLGELAEHCYYCPEPIISIIKPLEKIYRLKTVNEKNQEVAGPRYYPKPDEKIETSKFVIYIKYLVALLDRDKNGKFQILHDTPLSFSPRRKSGTVFKNEIYEPFKTCIASHYSNRIAPFVFAIKLEQEFEIWSQMNDNTKSTEVIRMSYTLPKSKSELNESFVGTEVGKVLEQWFVAYNPPTQNSDTGAETLSETTDLESFPY